MDDIRKTNLELLKVVSTIMIIILHYLNGNMGGALKETLSNTFNYYFIRVIESFCIIAVNCFVLITGYFMITKNSIRIKKVANLILISLFYSLVLYGISVLLKINTFSFNGLTTALMVMYNSKWFIVVYIGLYLLIPYLNKITLDMEKSQYRKFLIILFSILSIIPTAFPEVCYNDKGYGILSFILLYFIGGYIRLYYKPVKSTYYYFMIYFFCTMLTTSLVVGKMLKYNWWSYNTIVNVISSISLILLFLKFEFNSKIIVYLATFSLPVYIIHTDLSIRTLIYKTIFKCNKYWNSPDIFINMMKTVVGLYVGCILIDIIRRIILEPINNKMKIQQR